MFKHKNNTITDPVLIARHFNDLFTNIGPSLSSEVADTNIDPMSYLRGNYVHSLYLAPTDVSE